ncbi:MAG TPA: hypothetical protein VGL56_15900 [Fimbriimonadaceae bacterium]|jgi:hypothetical protein
MLEYPNRAFARYNRGVMNEDLKGADPRASVTLPLTLRELASILDMIEGYQMSAGQYSDDPNAGTNCFEDDIVRYVREQFQDQLERLRPKFGPPIEA